MGLSDTRTNRTATRLAGAAASTLNNLEVRAIPPRPWRYQERSDAYTHIIRAGENDFVCQLGSEVTARLIVRAVNAHDDMLAALKAMVKCSDDLGCVELPGSATAMARAAIAKAEAVGDRTEDTTMAAEA